MLYMRVNMRTNNLITTNNLIIEIACFISINYAYQYNPAVQEDNFYKKKK